jgi:hypothetical protein
MEEDLWNASVKIVSDHIVAIAIMVAVFAIIFGIALAVATGIGSIIGLASAVAGAYLTLVLIGFVWAFMIGWYVSSLHQAFMHVYSKRKINYVDSVVEGFWYLVRKREVLALLAGLGALAGLAEIPFAANPAAGIIGQIIGGAILAVAASIALLMLALRTERIDSKALGRINALSPEAGLFLYAIILIRIVPSGLGALLQFLGMPIAVAILVLYATRQGAMHGRHSHSSNAA